jgi:DNA-binding response OmpR family regulator
LDVFISRFRKYFANDTGISIQNVRNVGYIFGVDEE